MNITWRNINSLRYADDTSIAAENEEELKSRLMKVKEETENSGLPLNTHKTKIMASSPIISWQIDGKKVETVAEFIFLGSKITAGDYCSHEIKRHLLLRRKENEVDQSCLTLCDNMDCSLPGSSVHGIFQAIVLEWVPISFSRGSS